MLGRPSCRGIWEGMLVGSLLFTATDARAYCRKTTCDPIFEQCGRDDQGCVTDGVPLYWPGQVSIWSESAGTPLRGISGDAAEAALRDAYLAWMRVLCAGDQPPSVDATVRGQIDQPLLGFDEQSVVVYQDDEWIFDELEVAITTSTFDLDTGELLDADVEINSLWYSFTLSPVEGAWTGGPDVGLPEAGLLDGAAAEAGALDAATDGATVDAGSSDVDLLAVLTHEAGHVLGLDHSALPEATMAPVTEGIGFLALRSLEADDEAGLCAIYPPLPPLEEEEVVEVVRDAAVEKEAAPAQEEERSDVRCGCLIGRREQMPSRSGALVALAAVLALSRFGGRPRLRFRRRATRRR